MTSGKHHNVCPSPDCDNQGSGCMVDRPFREAIDTFHNGLRQRIAKGEA
ncbi:hypothetical protein ANCCAN_25645, partial [Ancylostoma caninum]